MQAPTVDIEVRRAGSNAVADIPLTLTGRRQDLSEAEAEREIAPPRATLAPGNCARTLRMVSTWSPSIICAPVLAVRGKPSAPVFLWPVADSARRSLSGPLQAL